MVMEADLTWHGEQTIQYTDDVFLYTWNLRNFINHCHPNFLKSLCHVCGHQTLSFILSCQVKCRTYFPKPTNSGNSYFRVTGRNSCKTKRFLLLTTRKSLDDGTSFQALKFFGFSTDSKKKSLEPREIPLKPYNAIVCWIKKHKHPNSLRSSIYKRIQLTQEQSEQVKGDPQIFWWYLNKKLWVWWKSFSFQREVSISIKNKPWQGVRVKSRFMKMFSHKIRRNWKKCQLALLQ